MADDNCVVLVLGKGDESTQIIYDKNSIFLIRRDFKNFK